MPASWSSAGTPQSGRLQQPLPPAIIPSILTRMGSEMAPPSATRRPILAPSSTTPRARPFSETTPGTCSGTGLPRFRLASPDEGAGGRDLPERFALLLGVERLYRVGAVDVGDLDGD